MLNKQYTQYFDCLLSLQCYIYIRIYIVGVQIKLVNKDLETLY